MAIPSHRRGFVALISVLLVSGILLTIIFTLNISSYFARFDIVASENKRKSLDLAEACVEVAKLKIAQSSLYTPAVGGDLVYVDQSQTCRICAVTTSGINQYTIATRAMMNGAYTNVVVSASIATSTFSVIRWEEKPIYSGPLCNL